MTLFSLAGPLKLMTPCIIQIEFKHCANRHSKVKDNLIIDNNVVIRKHLLEIKYFNYNYAYSLLHIHLDFFAVPVFISKLSRWFYREVVKKSSEEISQKRKLV